MSLRLLLALPQFPQDPSSGAARSLATMARWLARDGFEVRVSGVTATEMGLEPLPILQSHGISPSISRHSRRRPEWEYSLHDLQHRLLDTGACRYDTWQDRLGGEYDLLFDDELERFQPDLLLTYGGLPGDIARRRRAARKGIRVIFGLRNGNYLGAPSSCFECCHAILTPSRFLARLYCENLGLRSTPIPPPFEPDEIVAPDREPILITFINPSPEKGLMIAARIAEEIGARRPDLAMLVVESRGRAGDLHYAGLRGGFDLRRHENILCAPAVPLPRDIYGAAKLLLVPSLWEEGFGRVAVEALFNGVVPLVSDRGGLPETCEEAGYVLPLLPEWTPSLAVPPPASSVQAWLDRIFELEDDPALFEQQSALARRASRAFAPEVLRPRYQDFFLNAASTASPRGTPSSSTHRRPSTKAGRTRRLVRRPG